MVFPGTVVRIGSGLPKDVAKIKAKLNQLGYGPLDENNPNFGETSAKVVMEFQKMNHLHEDGAVGQLTWDRLFSPRVNKPVNSRILRYRALEIANTQLFVREKTGKNDGEYVKAYLNSVGLGEGFAWCQSFVYWAFSKSADQLDIANPVPKTGGVLECLRRAKEKGCSIYDEPEEGDQFIMDFGGGKGHTGLVEAVVGDCIYTIEGNTNGEGSREGDGVYERTRGIRSIKCFIRYE